LLSCSAAVVMFVFHEWSRRFDPKMARIVSIQERLGLFGALPTVFLVLSTSAISLVYPHGDRTVAADFFGLDISSFPAWRSALLFCAFLPILVAFGGYAFFPIYGFVKFGGEWDKLVSVEQQNSSRRNAENIDRPDAER